MKREILNRKNDTTAVMSAAVSDSRSGVNCSRTRVRRSALAELFTLSGGTAAVVGKLRYGGMPCK